MAENPRHAEQSDRAAVERDPGRRQVPLDLRARRRCAAVAVVGVVKAHSVETIARKQSQTARQAIDLAEVEQHPEHAVAQAVPARAQPPVHHRAHI